MGIQDLTQLVAPPLSPIDTGSSDEWIKVEEKLGLVLPQDYKAYVTVFGSGEIGGFFIPFNPFSPAEGLNLFARGSGILDALREIKAEFGETECPYPLYPEVGGLLPWGETENGDALFWLTGGEPDNWPVVINESRGPAFEQYDVSMTGFLVRVLTGEIVSKILPDDLPSTQNMFLQIK